MNHTPEVDFVFRILHPDMRQATLALMLITLMKNKSLIWMVSTGLATTDQDRLEQLVRLS
jgi:hypothetical protein